MKLFKKTLNWPSLFAIVCIFLTGCVPSQEETDACERAMNFVKSDMQLEKDYLIVNFGSKYDNEIHNVRNLYIKFRDTKGYLNSFLLSNERRATPAGPITSFNETNKGCALETVPGMAGKKIKDLSDDTPIYRCKLHNDHVILAKEFK